MVAIGGFSQAAVLRASEFVASSQGIAEPVFRLQTSAIDALHHIVADNPQYFDGRSLSEMFLRIALVEETDKTSKLTMDIVNECLPDDLEERYDEIRVIVDPISASTLRGSSVEFGVFGDRRGFKFSGPLFE